MSTRTLERIVAAAAAVGMTVTALVIVTFVWSEAQYSSTGFFPVLRELNQRVWPGDVDVLTTITWPSPAWLAVLVIAVSPLVMLRRVGRAGVRRAGELGEIPERPSEMPAQSPSTQGTGTAGPQISGGQAVSAASAGIDLVTDANDTLTEELLDGLDLLPGLGLAFGLAKEGVTAAYRELTMTSAERQERRILRVKNANEELRHAARYRLALERHLVSLEGLGTQADHWWRSQVEQPPRWGLGRASVRRRHLLHYTHGGYDTYEMKRREAIAETNSAVRRLDERAASLRRTIIRNGGAVEDFHASDHHARTARAQTPQRTIWQDFDLQPHSYAEVTTKTNGGHASAQQRHERDRLATLLRSYEDLRNSPDADPRQVEKARRRHVAAKAEFAARWA